MSECEKGTRRALHQLCKASQETKLKQSERKSKSKSGGADCGECGVEEKEGRIVGGGQLPYLCVREG